MWAELDPADLREVPVRTSLQRAGCHGQLFHQGCSGTVVEMREKNLRAHRGMGAGLRRHEYYLLRERW
jgi:hypothetical protein